MSSGSFSRRTILRAFEALSDELGQQGLKGELFVVGGAAMALVYSARRVTRDIDAIFEPKAEIYESARRVAERLDLPDDWLNDAVKSYAPGNDRNGQRVFQSTHLQATAASPEYLLAMKLLAARVDQDTDDIRTLYGILGFTTADQGLDLVERFYPSRRFEARTQFLLEELFGPAQHRRSDTVPEVDDLFDPQTDERATRLAASTSVPTRTAVRKGTVRCEARNQDGSRCRNELLPGSACPAHGWRSPR